MTLKELHEPSVGKWLWLAAGNWLQIILLFIAAGHLDHWASYLVAWILLGTRLHGLALLGHEGIHYNLSRRKGLNDALANLFTALPLTMTVNWFRKFHLTHHQHVLGADDPEVAFRAKAPGRWSTPMTPLKRVGLVALDLSGIGFLEARHVVSFAWKHMTAWDLILPAVFWALVWSCAYLLDALWVPLLWSVSIPTSYWAMFRQRALVEHLGSHGTHRTHAHPLARFFYLPHNSWYHWEHHEWAQIPCWNLPQARELDAQEPVVTLPELFRALAQQR